MKSETTAIEGTFGRTQTWQDRRTIRALMGTMQVVADGDGTDLYTVYSGSGNAYTVDLRDAPACTCPDFQHREEVAACKHIRRAYVESGRVAIPADVDLTALDDLLLRGIREGRVRVGPTRQVATDGGREAGAETEANAEGR